MQLGQQFELTLTAASVLATLGEQCQDYPLQMMHAKALVMMA